MKNLMLIFVLSIASVLVVLPTDANASSPQRWERRQNDRNYRNRESSRWQWRNRERRRRNGRWYGYRNYGQYRRTQVGNRRFRLARRTYWRNGTRVTRWTRIYY